RRKSHHTAITVAATTGTQQHNCGKGYPATDGVNHHGAGKVVKRSTKAVFQPALEAVVTVPDHAFKERIYESYRQSRSNQNRVELCTFGNTTGHNGRNRRSKGQQEEELHQVVTIIRYQFAGAAEEVRPIGNLITDEKV